MLISCSRRTDVPAFYSDWLVNRVRAGFCYVRNPMNPSHVSHVSLAPEVVDGLVLWTKNPEPLLPKLHELREFQYYFQFTLTPYGADIEQGLPPKRDAIIPSFLRLADAIGAERVLWRYDPILLSPKYDFDYHVRAFSRLCELFEGRTKTVTISFLQNYRNIAKSLRELGVTEPELHEKLRLAQRLKSIAESCGIETRGCCSLPELAGVGISPARCVSRELFESLGGVQLNIPRDRNQRDSCNCSVSVDIGEYSSCRNGCRYCYANHGTRRVAESAFLHNPNSPLLIGDLRGGDIVTEREMKSAKQPMLGL